jgi:two-component system response regulator RegA
MKKILIVDDDLALSAALARSFVRRGYVAQTAQNANEALTLAQEFQPHYAVVDLRMTGPTGLDCTKALHALDPNLRIVVLTGYASIATAVEAIKLGACHYLAKPANSDDIIAAFAREDGTTEVAISPRKSSIKNLEWERIQEVLLETNYNISETARRLGMHRRTLARKLAKQPVK